MLSSPRPGVHLLHLAIAALALTNVALARPSPRYFNKRGVTERELVQARTEPHSLPERDVNSTIDWSPCAQDANLTCTSITVPKTAFYIAQNYFNSTKGTSTIALAKLASSAPDEAKLGTLFVNPGGPGGSGISFMVEAATLVSALSGGLYDVIGFDPRGVGASTPRIDCFPSTLEFNQFKANTIIEKGSDIPPDPFSSAGFTTLVNQQTDFEANLAAWYAVCSANLDLEDLQQSGTSTVVRDLNFISNLLGGEDARINYIGFSYGTIIGAYMINMLPASKIGRVILDGIVDASLWVSTPTFTESAEAVQSAETAFQWFLTDCAAAGPTGCALASSNSTARSIQHTLESFLDDLFTTPVPVIDTIRPGFLNSGLARAFLYASLEQPGNWPDVATAFALALAGEPKTLYEQVILPFNTTNDLGDTSRQAVSCADTLLPSPKQTTSEFLAREVQKALKVSPHFGGSVQSLEPDGGCQFWGNGQKAQGTFTGPFNASLENPILLVSNTADPDTSLKNGVQLHKTLGSSSRLLIQNSPGHTSQQETSSCTQLAYASYLINGTLPESYTVCELDNPSFFDLPQTNNASAIATVTAFAKRVEEEALKRFLS
ncbi:hypothetical protein RQP46_001671 [Phenoliferia psychrophenolica]